jgi:hypothetical protein
MIREDASEIPIKDKSEFNVLYFATTMILQMISFWFLFNFRSSEYIVYIFSLLVFCVSPFVWIKDLLAIGNVLNKDSIYYTLFLYKGLSLAISSVLVIAGMFLVIMSNEITRKQKVEKKRKSGNPAPSADNVDIDQNNAKLDNLTTTPMQETRSKTILILYTTIITLMWGMVLEAFSRSCSFGKDGRSGYKSGFATLIGHILDKPYTWVSSSEKKWINYTTQIKVSPLCKSFLLYFTTFLVIFFGLFARVSLGVNKYKIVNMGNMFGSNFYRNVGYYRDAAIFFTCLILCLFLYICLLQVGEVFRTFVKFAFLPLLVLIFGLFFGLRKTFDVLGVQNLIMFLIALLLAFLGTPVIIALVQLLCEIRGWSLNSNHFPPVYIASLFGVFVFLPLFLLTFILGMKWVADDSFKNLQMMNVIIVCMAVSSFVSLTPAYTVFTNMYNVIKFIIEVLLIYIVPLLIVVLSLVLFIFSLKNRNGGLVTDG